MSVVKLPEGIHESDLSRPSYDVVKDWRQSYDLRSFELWFTQGFGWCIPTLDISRRGRGGMPRRTYAVIVSSGRQCRIGQGPHVTRTVVVYLRPSTLKRLQRFLDLREKGQADAGMTRDRISSRRAQGQQMRAEGRRSWRWDV